MTEGVTAPKADWVREDLAVEAPEIGRLVKAPCLSCAEDGDTRLDIWI
jgi:hypothetical protein